MDRDTARGTQVATEIGGLFIETDVADEASVRQTIEGAQAKMGNITVAVNCAGIVDALKTAGGTVPTRWTCSSVQLMSIGSGLLISTVLLPKRCKAIPQMAGARVA